VTELLPSFERLLVALLVGFLIGLDRERTEARKAHRLFAGVRTFPLIALAGAVPMLLMARTGPALLVASFVAVAGVAVVSYLRSSAAGDIGATTEMAALATFLLGALAGGGDMVVAAAAGVAVAVLLVAKPRLEAFSRALTQEELAATLELAVISIIVLPLAPNHGYGPWQLLNPFEIWLIVVLVSALGFAGFVAVRLWGQQRGLAVTGIVGALVSSTAVTVAMATQAREAKGLARTAAAATVLASTIMCARVLVLTGAIDARILPRLLPVAGAMATVGGIGAWLLGRHAEPTGSEAPSTTFSNPFKLTAATSFGVMFALILVLVRVAQEYGGARGLYAAAGLSALADVDAVSMALTRLGSSQGTWATPATGVNIAMVTNTLVKMAIALVMGAGRFRRYVAQALLAMSAIGAVAAAVVAVT
jgi:uncharacterized membrane protein (DUF4010 family)